MKRFAIFADNLFAHEVLHFLSGVGMFFLMYRLFGKYSLSLVAFFAGILIDIDHYFEGLIYNRFKINWIFNTYPHTFWQKYGRMTILFHSWELLFLILVLGEIFNLEPLAIAVVVPCILHLSLDNLIYSGFRKMPVLQYFFIFRLYHKFDYKILCPGNTDTGN